MPKHKEVDSRVPDLPKRIAKYGSWAAAAIVIIFLFKGCNEWATKKRLEKQQTNEASANSTAELPSLISLVQSNKIEDCPGEDVELAESSPGHVAVGCRPCRSAYVSLPPDWTKFDEYRSVPDGELIFWDISGRRYDLPPGKTSKSTRVGNTFRVACKPGGTLHLYNHNKAGAQVASNFSAPEQEASGSVVQWVHEMDLLILKTEKGEERFKATKNTRVAHGYKFYYLGNQGFFSSKEGASLRPGDEVKIRFRETDRYVVTIDITKVAQPPASNEAQRADSYAPKERSIAGETTSTPKEVVVRGRIDSVNEEGGEIFLEKNGQLQPVSFSEETTTVFVNGEECQIGSLRVGDIARAYFAEGSTTAHRIEVGTTTQNRYEPSNPLSQLMRRAGREPVTPSRNPISAVLSKR